MERVVLTISKKKKKKLVKKSKNISVARYHFIVVTVCCLFHCVASLPPLSSSTPSHLSLIDPSMASLVESGWQVLSLSLSHNLHLSIILLPIISFSGGFLSYLRLADFSSPHCDTCGCYPPLWIALIHRIEFGFVSIAVLF